MSLPLQEISSASIANNKWLTNRNKGSTLETSYVYYVYDTANCDEVWYECKGLRKSVDCFEYINGSIADQEIREKIFATITNLEEQSKDYEEKQNTNDDLLNPKNKSKGFIFIHNSSTKQIVKVYIGWGLFSIEDYHLKSISCPPLILSEILQLNSPPLENISQQAINPNA
ncbi:hypothetical protein GJ496_008798 [Pomphorhynchus laevis]|nr:hypothetical protein GJ496_008798 [Pomphorhynchus laevis]